MGPREPFCLSVGWLERSNAVRKCMFELVAAVPLVLRQCPDLRFKIAGDPADAGADLRCLAASLGVADRVEWLGRISEAAKIRLMQTCQVYAQPSRFEGFGLAIAEALGCGAPVVTSRVGAVPEVAGDCAEYVDGTRPEEIAAAVTRLARDPVLRAQRSAAGRARVESCLALQQRQEALASGIESLLNGGAATRHRPARS